jgi:hypothetical protein
MHLFADEDFPLPAVARLRELGHDVLTIQEAGIGNEETPDADVLTLATRLGRALLTHNRKDFKVLHRSGGEHAGIIACTHDRDFKRLAERVHEQNEDKADLRNAFIRVIRPQPRE